MIKKGGNRWWVVVYAGRDPLTGRKRQRTGTAASKSLNDRPASRPRSISAGQVSARPLWWHLVPARRLTRG